MNNNVINKGSDNIRILSAAMVEKAKSGHPGGAMGGADFVNVLFSEFLNFDPSDGTWINRDRFFLDPGHMSPMLYSILAFYGHYTMDELANFRQWGSPTPGHPEVDAARGVENTSGPLGQGHTFAIGAAIAEKFLVEKFGDWMSHKIYTFISDGGVQEEISQGAGRIAGNLGLNNLIMFYDSNDIQLSTTVKEVTSEDTAKKYESWGWKVLEIAGNDPDAIRGALKEANAETEKPVLIIGKTIMGKGAVDAQGNSFEGKTSTHGQPLSAAGASFEKTIENLGGNPDNPFTIFPEVKEWLDGIIKEKTAAAAAKKAEQAAWAKANPALAAKLDQFFSGKLPEIDWKGITQKSGVATRAASASVLGILAENVENMIVSSADLSNSDKTDGFLNKTRAITRDDFGGAFLQSGVCELTMAAICNGLALHGGIIPACGTFFVFSDYIKPALRTAALMELQVIYVWTHDAFRVGEDGPTHQPVEHEAQLRLMEQLQNHSHKNSTLVLRPADAQETTVAWKMALENTSTPTALILSRQNITELPAASGDRAAEAFNAEKGAYIVAEAGGSPDVVLVASGSEVSTLVAGAALLKEKKGLKVQIVSAPSEGLFRNQDAAYQEKVLPSGVPTFGMTAGLPVTLQGLVGTKGKVFGLNSFGFSAPAGVLDEKLGYTAENVYNQVLEFLG
ncbi:transketolase [Oceanispirochaeta crateris]|uniref:transketolase n=1 Tax=Oceanispirochaeta crateris TaxID=2518645 RepID=A0A5C1QSH3_9SPIO|nr:transketolase [Oceanispirochaeta crateris]QEN09546.1 transketolase [Oceanispirochaeta crateris]